MELYACKNKEIVILNHYFNRASFMQLLYDSRVAPMRLRYSLHTSGIRPAYGWHTVDIRQFCVINQVRKSSSSFLCVSPRFFIMWITLHRVNAVFMIKNCKRRPSTRSDRKKYCWCPLHCRMHMKNILRTRACFFALFWPPNCQPQQQEQASNTAVDHGIAPCCCCCCCCCCWW